MLTALILGVLAGFVVSISPGPVTATLIAKTVETGRRQTMVFACGAALCEVLYASAAILGMDLLIPVRAQGLINGAGFLLLLGMGIRYTFFDVVPASQKEKSISASNSFVLGLILPLTTPTIGASYVVIAGLLHTNGLLATEVSARNAFAAGTGAGTFLWLSAMMMTVEKLQKNAGLKIVRITARGAGMFMLLAAAYVGKGLILLVQTIAVQ